MTHPIRDMGASWQDYAKNITTKEKTRFPEIEIIAENKNPNDDLIAIENSDKVKHTYKSSLEELTEKFGNIDSEKKIRDLFVAALRVIEKEEQIKHDKLFKKKWWHRKKDINVDTLSSLIDTYRDIPLSEVTALICDKDGNFLSYNEAIDLSEAKLIETLSNNENQTKSNLTNNDIINNIKEMNRNSKKMNNLCEKTKISSLTSAYVHVAKRMAGENIFGFINSTLNNTPIVEVVKDELATTKPKKESWLSKIKSSKFSFGFINKTHFAGFCALGATTYISGANYMAAPGTSLISEVFLLYSGYKFLQSGYFATHSKELKKELAIIMRKDKDDNLISDDPKFKLHLKMLRGYTLTGGYLTHLATSAVADISLPAIVSTAAIGAGAITVVGCGVVFAASSFLSAATTLDKSDEHPIVKIPTLKERIKSVLSSNQKEIGS